MKHEIMSKSFKINFGVMNPHYIYMPNHIWMVNIITHALPLRQIAIGYALIN